MTNLEEIKILDEMINEKDKEMEKIKIILKEMYDTCIGYNEMKSIVTPDNKYLFSSFTISVELYRKFENIINDIKRD